MDMFHTITPEFILTTFGVVGLLIVVFAESGLFFGFFLPGDSLLFTAGFLAPMLDVNIYLLILGICIAAVLGDSVGYWFGKKVGDALFTKDDSLIFKKKHVERAQVFFNQYGAKSIVLARFIPIVRTFTPIVAGAAHMKYKVFLTWNIIGGFIWGAGITSAGYFLGRLIPSSEQYLSYIIVGIILISLLPILLEVLKKHK